MDNPSFISDNHNGISKYDKTDDIELNNIKINSPNEITHINKAIEELGTGKCHYLLLFVSGGSLLGLVAELINMGFVAPSVRCEFGVLTSTEQGLLLSMGFLGIVVSSHFWGFLTDTWGRKSSLKLALSTGFIISCISAFSINTLMLIITRFLTGLCVSGIQSASLIYLGEFHGNHTRAKAVTLAAMCMVLALVYISLIAWIILPYEFHIQIPNMPIEFRAWRLNIIICSSILFIIFCVLCYLPESPQFLLTMNKKKECLEALKYVYKMNNSKSSTNNKIYPIKDIYTDTIGTNIANISIRDCGQIIWKQTVPIFNKPLLKNTMIMCYLSFVLFLIAHGMNTWLPRIFTDMISFIDEPRTMCEIMNRQSTGTSEISNMGQTNSTKLHDNDACSNTSNSNVYQILMIYTGGCMAIFFIVAMYMKKIGLKLVLIIWLFISAITGFACIFVNNFNIFLLMIICFLSCGNCGCIIGAISQDLFPTNIRAMALCIIFMFGRIGSVIGSNIIGVLIAINCDMIFFIYGGLLISCAGLCFYLPKTSGSK